MNSEILRLLAVVAVGWAVTFALRSLPFVLFGRSDGRVGQWVSRFGAFISPVILAGLVVYSYSGLEWRTAWPYLAGALTVALQLKWRNPLASIFAGTVVYMCCLNCGCVSESVARMDAASPTLSVSATGVRYGGELVEAAAVPELLADAGIPRDETVHILVEEDMKNLSNARRLMAILARGGYRQSVLVTKRHAEAETKSTGKGRRK